MICTEWIETKPATANKSLGELGLLPAAALVPLPKAEQELSSHPPQAAPITTKLFAPSAGIILSPYQKNPTHPTPEKLSKEGLIEMNETT